MTWGGGDDRGVWWQRPWSLPLVSGVVAALQIAGSYAAAYRGGQHLGLWGVLLLLVGPVALLGRLRWPAATLVVTVAGLVVYYGLGFPYGPAFLSLVVAALAAVGAGHRVLAWVAVVAGLGMYFLLSVVVAGDRAPSWASIVGHLAAVTVIVALAELIRYRRREYLARRRSRAEQERRQANEERLRIAQELHDVLAHNISLINVQAGVALHLMDQRPEQARTALTTIKHASKEALGEMRSALAVLRGDGIAPRSPTPGLDRLGELTARLDASGLPVRTAVSGRRRDLPVEVDLAAYRIVQEALTNVYRHANAAEAVVKLAYGEDTLTVTVTDDGTGAPMPTDDPDGGGNGIPGMRQRATALGGSLTAGPAPGGGFRVTARLPLAGVPAG
ncbi:sensor histidine kinase [Actinocatenispora rupis]|uniref:sensor histidine kinase n=1 Tax=Actinocatenispora rupis TaxID=519421 RepID=UPI0023B234CC|nr:sensor histidine kinase [Actinocatenispora rupis]